MPITQLPDQNKPYLLFTDASKYCYSGMLTQASMDESNKALVKPLTDKEPFTSVESQTQDLKLNFNLVHPVAYISGSFTESQCRWPAITRECFGIFMSIKKCSFYLRNSDLFSQVIFTGNTENTKFLPMGLRNGNHPKMCQSTKH